MTREIHIRAAFADFLMESGIGQGDVHDDEERRIKSDLDAARTVRRGRNYTLVMPLSGASAGWLWEMAQLPLGGGGEWTSAEHAGAQDVLDKLKAIGEK